MEVANMQTFKDWAGQEIEYEFRFEPLHEDTNEKEFTCYIKPEGSWFAAGGAKTKEKALEIAIDAWNYIDNEGRG
jgi:hypothetical protein